MRTVSGDHHICGTLMRTLTEMEGEHADLAPEIVIKWDRGAEKKSLDHIRLVSEIAMAGGFGTDADLPQWYADQLLGER
jgi:hypothetical protein